MKLALGASAKLLLPDGSYYTFAGPLPSAAESFTDVNGNTLYYSVTEHGSGSVTDSLGRKIADPLTHNWYAQYETPRTYEANLPGLNSSTQNYQFTWRHLKPLGCETSTDPDCVGKNETRGGALEDQTQKLFYRNRYMCSGNTDEDLGTAEVLFTDSAQNGVRGCNSIDLLRDEQGEPILDPNGRPFPIPVRFNPVVLTKVQLPNGQSYEFAYNRFGEITRITYPSGAYETFVYGGVAPVGQYPPNIPYAYSETDRGVHERRIYSGDNVLQQIWTYTSARVLGVNVNYYKITITASSSSNPGAPGGRTERYLFVRDSTFVPKFGFNDPRVGRPIDEWSFDEAGQLRSRVLTKYAVKTYQLYPPYTPVAYRDPRVEQVATITFEPGSDTALATMTETAFDENGSNDPEQFSHLNVKSQKSYHYAAVPRTTAESTSLSWTTINGWFPSSKLASVTQTDYIYDAAYKARGITSLPVRTLVLDPANPNPSSTPLAKTETIYDNQVPSASANYPTDFAVETYGGLSNLDCTPGQSPSTICWASPNPATTIFGRPTTTRVWKKEDNSWIESHSRYDIFGNVIAARDPIGNEATTTFSSTYKYAYPTSVTSPAPDPTNTTGTNVPSTVTTAYDLNTGLPVSVTDDFGQTTSTQYSDPLLRPTRAYSTNFTAPETQTVYDDNARTVKVRKQIDETNWEEATTFMDSLGRTIKTQAKDSQGDVFVETHYDLLGRVERVTNPYRVGDIVYWNKTRYDAAGRAVQTFAPATIAEINTAATNNNANLTSLGTTAFGISSVTDYIGAFVTTTDASGRKGRSITNALGQLLRVDEPTAIGGTVDADLGAIGTPLQPTSYRYDAYGKMVEVTQGVQKRWFKYDSLGRLLRVRQPEQEINTALNMSDPFNTSGQWTAGFTYDAIGNVIRATDANGVNTVNEYDRAGRVTKRCYTKPNVNSTASNCSQISSGDQSTDTPTVTFWYDGKGLTAPQSPNYAKGKLTKVANGISTTENMTFDNLGRLTRSKQITDGVEYGGGTDPSVWMTYTYNLSGALIEEQYPSGRKVKNEFESDGDLRRIFGRSTPTATERTYANSFSYTPDGKIEKLQLGNDLWESAEFNSRLQVKALNLGHGPAAGDLWRLVYEYGELNTDGSVNENKNTGNIARQTVGFNGLAHPFVQSYKYDALYRLTEARETKNSVQTWIQGFGYDRYGNRTSTSQLINGSTINTTPDVDQNTNQFTSSSFDYDKNGNVVMDVDPATSQMRTVVFNADNKQREVKNANGITIGRYYYDGEGKRVKKVTDLETTVYLYSSGKLISEYSTASPPANPTTNYTVTDMLGSPRVLTNSLGQVVSRRDFAPFGEEIFADAENRTTGNNYSNTGTDAVRKRFTGYEKDTETGLDFAENRMYENRYGKFTAVDPLLASGKSAHPQTFNRYVYVLNNPLVLTDPDGLQVGNHTGSVYYKVIKGAWAFSDTPGKGYNTRYVGPTKTIIGIDGYRYRVSSNGWIQGKRETTGTPAAVASPSQNISTSITKPEPVDSLTKERIRDLTKAVTNQGSFQVADRITNPDSTALQFQAPLTNTSASIGITRNFDVTLGFGQGRNFGEFKSLATAGRFGDIVNAKTLFGGLSVQSTAILEPEREITQPSRLAFVTAGSVNAGGCLRFCGGMTFSPQDDGNYRRGVTWGLSATSAPSGGVDVNYAPETWTFNPHRWFFGPTHQNGPR